MPLLKPEDISTSGPQGVAESERPVIYMAGPTPVNETELGPIMEKLYERFYNRADFVDPVSLHGDSEGGEDDLVDINNKRYWNDEGGFREDEFEKERTKRVDDSIIIDILRGDLDEALGFEGYVERFLDIVVNSLDEAVKFDIPTLIDPNLNPLPPTPFFKFDLLPIDIDIFGGVVEFVKQLIYQSLQTVADAVLVSRKAGHNMVGAAMEVKEAHELDMPVAVYDHSDKEDSNPIPVMLDQHSDYVTNNPNWAVSWLIQEVENRKEKGDVEEITSDPNERRDG